MKTAESYDYSYYPLIAARPSNTRAFKLEGYLFPNTYDFYKNEKPQDAIGRFLRISEKYITSADRAKAKSMGYSMDQVLTVASIIEKRARTPMRSERLPPSYTTASRQVCSCRWIRESTISNAASNPISPATSTATTACIICTNARVCPQVRYATPARGR